MQAGNVSLGVLELVASVKSYWAVPGRRLRQITKCTAITPHLGLIPAIMNTLRREYSCAST